MVLKYVKLAIGFRFLEASQAVITFIDKESMEKELINGCSARLEKLLLLSQTMEEGSKSYRQICLGVYFGTASDRLELQNVLNLLLKM
jgi:hypothetical protein